MKTIAIAALLCLPWAFAGMYADYVWGFDWALYVLPAVPVLLGWLCIRRDRFSAAMIAGIVSAGLSLVLAHFLLRGSGHYFKPFDEHLMVLFLGTLALAPQILLQRRQHRDTEPTLVMQFFTNVSALLLGFLAVALAFLLLATWLM